MGANRFRVSLRHSLKLRLALTIGLLAIVTTLLLSNIVSLFSKQQIRADRGTLLREVAAQMADRLSQDMNTRAQEILFLTGLEAIRDPLIPLEEKQALFEQIKAAHPHYAWIGITDVSGTILAGTGGLLVGKSVAQRAWFTEGRQGLHFGNAHDAFLLAQWVPKPRWDDLPLRLVDVSAPVRDEAGRLLGVICGHLSLDWAFEVRESMLANLRDRVADMIVLNHDGRVLMGTPSLPSLSADLSGLDARRHPAAPVVDTWPDGKNYLTAAVTEPGFRDYPGMGWTVVARQDEDEAFAPARALGTRVMALGVAFAALFAGMLWWILSRELRPLESMSQAANRIRAQDLSTPIPRIRGHDEIAVFSRSLTALVDSLLDTNAELRLTSRVFEESSQGIIIADAQRNILRVNRAFSEITRYEEPEVVGRNPSLLRSDRHDADFYRSTWGSVAATGAWRGEIWNRRKDGALYPEWLNINALTDETGQVTHYIGLFNDISEKKAYEERLLHLANYDPLTDLPNRNLLQHEMAAALSHARAAHSLLAVLFVDLDQFKHINDTLGHPAGDRVLREVARRFEAVIGPAETVARWGGDEFVLVVPDANGAAAARTAEKLTEALFAPCSLEQGDYHVGASIGIALFPRDSRSVDGLLRCADTAMYQAKQAGKNGHAFFEPSMNARMEQFLLIDNALRNAIRNGELSLAFQPQFASDARTLTGAEALLRWHHPALGEVGPSTFIPVAEETGQIAPIGLWVLEQAMRASRTIAGRAGTPLPLSVNLSARQLTDASLPDRLHEMALTLNVRPDLLKLEVTESAIMSDETAAIRVLERLKAHGFPISIDDFGTGYSCLNYINRIRPDEIKLDRSFIRNMAESDDCRNIVVFTVGLAATMGMDLVAEGVETTEQLALLRDIGDLHLQGFLLGRPVDLDELFPPAPDGPAPKDD